MDAQTLAKKKAEAYNKAVTDAKRVIRSPDTPKTLNTGAQNKHIKGSKGYIEDRSYIFGDLETAQTLVNRYSGTGEPVLTHAGLWANKEIVRADKTIGVSINPETKEETITKQFTIHYGKHGTHIVPRKEEQAK